MQNDSPARRVGGQPENGNAVRSSLYVRAPDGIKQRDRRVECLAHKMRLAMPWLEDSDMPAARAWAELEVLSQRVYAELRARGIVNGEGDARRLLDDYRKLRATQIVLSRELGMTPAARMAIKAGSTTAALDLVSLMARQPDSSEPLETAAANR